MLAKNYHIFALVARSISDILTALFRRRAILILIILFGGAILILAYSGIHSSRKNMLQLLTSEGRSLLQSLIVSAQNNVAASAIVEQATSDHLMDIATTLGTVLDQNRSFLDSLDVLQRRYRLGRIDVVNAKGNVIASSWSETIGSQIGKDDDFYEVMDSVQSGRTETAIATPTPSLLSRADFVKVAVRIRSGVLLLEAETKKLTDYQRSLGIGFLVRQLGRQQGVAYVALQSDSGIVLGSRDIGWMVAIEADTFLTNAAEHGQMVNRIYDFHGTDVLEVVRAFRSDALPSGIFRLGMSLESYDRLYHSSLKQLAILSVVLFVLGIVGSYAAVSSRRLQLAATDLEQLKTLTNEIIDSVETAIVATDHAGYITIFNPQAESLFSFSARAVLGQPYLSVFKKDEIFLDEMARAASSVKRGEITLKSTGDEFKHLLVSASPILDIEGAYTGSVSLVYDLSEMKRLEEAARTSERLSELGNLAAGVAHEIRNPLNAISIAAQRLHHEFTPSENVDEYTGFLKTITAEIERLNVIIKDFLALARGGRIQKVLVDLDEYLTDIVALVSLEAGQKMVAVKVAVERELKAEIDKLEMNKVIVNLLKNAIEAADPGGSVEINARAAESGKVDIEISNSGKPIPEEIRRKIFQPYFTTKSEGTGLGLAICHRIVADHGGRLELLDREPTTFRITV